MAYCEGDGAPRVVSVPNDGRILVVFRGELPDGTPFHARGQTREGVTVAPITDPELLGNNIQFAGYFARASWLRRCVRMARCS